MLGKVLLSSAAAVVLLALTLRGEQEPSPSSISPRKPNILLFFTDDQNAHDADSALESMKNVDKLLRQQGLEANTFHSPISICCPARSSFLRVQAAHNHNITDVLPPYGGWPLFNAFGLNGEWLPTFMQRAGYYVAYTGKLMNGHSEKTAIEMPARGVNSSDYLVDPWTYAYHNASLVHDNTVLTSHAGEYLGDVLADRSLEQLDKALSQDRPFFLTIAPIAPHSTMSPNHLFALPEVAPRFQGLFDNYRLDRTAASFNPDNPSGVSWVKKLPRLEQDNVDYIEEFYRRRLGSLQSVDELVGQVINRLEQSGQLDNTYIFYTADNGFECNGGHRRQPGKTLPFEEDIRVPFLARGPGIEPGSRDCGSHYSLVDLSQTILKLAGAKATYETDGANIPLNAQERAQAIAEGSYKQHHLVEFWAQGVIEGKFADAHMVGNTTYRAIRVRDDTQHHDWMYSHWCTGESELYAMHEDPYQMNNLADPARIQSVSLKLIDRLDALLVVLKRCRGDACRLPWQQLFPQGRVKSLHDALNPKYDEYFSSLPKFSYKSCKLGFHLDNESSDWNSNLAYKGAP